MKRREVGVSFLNYEGPQGKTKGYVVEGVRFCILIGGEDSGGDGELEGGRHCGCGIVI